MKKAHSACSAAALTILAQCGFAVAAFSPAAGRPLIVAQAEAPKIFQGVGKITAIDASAGALTIDHEEIPGLMDAMEMQYEARPAKLLDGLNVGDKVEFGVDGKTLTILEIRKRVAAR